jgi:Ig-like domain-containing protein/putative Ig domain-containing protein
MRTKVKVSAFSLVFLQQQHHVCCLLACVFALACASAAPGFAQSIQPMVAVHDSELTRALESMPASGSTPTGPGTTGNQWWPTDWHYFVMPEAVKESLRSDGTPFAVVSDSNIAAGLLLSNGAPCYPIVVSLASEAIRDDEIAAFTNYVAAGGFLLVGSSSFTRTTNGIARGDFAFANELGLHTATTGLNNWAQNNNFTKTNQPAHRLISHIPSGQLTWRMPSSSEEIPWGVSPSHPFLAPHDVWRVRTTTATVLAQGDATPLITIKPFGKGYFIYCSAFQPLIGHSGFAPGMYAYVIFRRAIEWAFESAQLPLPKLSPWPYQYDAAWMIRHDLENFTNEIAGIEASAQVEFTNGAKGDYYFCTGTLRDDASPTYNTNNVVASLRRAVTNYGATIGPHNGGLKNPNNPALVRGDYDYWHWGPDEALDTTPAGYANGKAYALASLSTSFLNVESWLKGITNGLRSWVGCYFNATRDDSYDLQAQLGVKIAGDQKLTPFPHWTFSTATPGKRYALLSEPVSDWFVNGLVAQSLEPWHSPGIQTSQTLHEGIDFYYGLGALINFYSHTLSTGFGDAGQLVPDYITYSLNTNLHPRIWSANAASIYTWWLARSNAQVNFNFSTNGYQSLLNVSIRGATDPNTAVEFLLPGTNQPCTIQVWTNGNLAAADNYRLTGQLIKLRVGNSVTNAIISYYPLGQSTAFYSQNFDSVTAPALPSGWTTSATGVQTPWVTQASGGDTAPNSAFSSDPADVGINELVSPAINLPSGASQLTFRHSYDLETGPGADGFDGGVLEIKIGTNPFADVLTSGATFVIGGYNSVIDTQWANPLAGRPAWSGNSGGLITTTVNLPSAAGQPIQLRWRCGSDNSNGKTGWHVDSISISARACLCCNGASNTAPVLPSQSDRIIAALAPLSVNNAASDLDLPPQLLLYQLIAPPAGATIDINGVITWTPSAAQALTTNLITTVVTDNGSPALSATNSFQVIVSNPSTPPQITSQPVSVTNNAGASASFTITATGTSPSYQWFKNGGIALANGGNITGANSTSLTLANVSTSDAGNYSVTVSNPAGSVSSATASLTVIDTNSPPPQFFSDDFTRGTDPAPISPWVAQSGAWSITGGVLKAGPDAASSGYGYAYLTNSWANYSVQARIRFSTTSAYGGGIGARLNPLTGSHYAAWIYPENSSGGSSVLRLVKFQQWTAFGYNNVAFQPVLQVSLPGVGTNWHTLKLNVQDTQLSALYDGALVATATDTEASPYPTGGVSVDMWTDATPYAMSIDDVIVTTTNNAPNTPPTLPTQPNFTIGELSALIVTNTATDSDVPANTLTYSLLTPPTGAVISSSGVISWTPTEAQGPGTYTITTRVVDNGTPALSATNSFSVTVTEVNSAPVLPAQVNRTIPELTTLTVTNRATDSDLPANTLAYTLLMKPAGAAISTNGIITWTPSEAQGPSTNLFTTVVTDSGAPARGATNSFTVTVTEVNQSPVLPPQSNRTIISKTLLTVTNVASDADLPANTLTYALVSPPTGVKISAGGIITWTPTASQTNVYVITTTVKDSGTPRLSATNRFSVTVVPPGTIIPGVSELVVSSTGPVIQSVWVQDGQAVLTWSAIPGNTYRLQYSDDPSSTNWTNDAPDLIAIDSTVTATNAVGDLPKRFYRVMQLP